MPIRIGEKLIKLSDIAKIHRGYEEPATYLIRAGGEEAILLGVVMKKGENGLDLGKRMNKFLEYERSHLPLGMQLVQLTNQAKAISGAVNLFQIKFLVAVIVVQPGLWFCRVTRIDRACRDFNAQHFNPDATSLR